ncbi:MAG: beta-ketoacyl-[acyl-carrier-protein] synthase family protein [Bacteroidales bacterium]|nr:beta-ketoacyl-[acyl-carrier-protein] synthase family protein [Bacteroidales bacterium]
MATRICISGSGVVSSIGIGKKENLASLLAKTRGISGPKYLNTQFTELPVGEVPLSNAQMKKLLGIAASEPLPRTSLMAMLAVKEALEEAGNLGTGPRAFLSGTTVGGMDLGDASYPEAAVPEGNKFTCGDSTSVVADFFGGFSLVTTPSTACSSAANALILGARLIRAGLFDVVVAGGSESLSRFHLNGFNALMILDKEPCRPFDKSRAGLNLGEGAAFLVLESEAHALARGVKPQTFLSGWGNACDAYHQTASSPDGDGAYDAMAQALRIAGLKPSDIDYVNAHGTGTPNNDASESAALRRIFGEALPPVSSTKAYTGHTTSASGSIEAVFCLLALQEGFIPPQLGWSIPDPDCILPLCHTEQSEVSHVLCNAFGFGGNDSALIFSKAL